MMLPSGVNHSYNELDTGLVTRMVENPSVSQMSGDSVSAAPVGARKRPVGARRPVGSAVNEADDLVFTIILLHGVPPTSPPRSVTGSRPSFVRLMENSMNCAATYFPFVVDAGPGLE